MQESAFFPAVPPDDEWIIRTFRVSVISLPFLIIIAYSYRIVKVMQLMFLLYETSGYGIRHDRNFWVIFISGRRSNDVGLKRSLLCSSRLFAEDSLF